MNIPISLTQQTICVLCRKTKLLTHRSLKSSGGHKTSHSMELRDKFSKKRTQKLLLELRWFEFFLSSFMSWGWKWKVLIFLQGNCIMHVLMFRISKKWKPSEFSNMAVMYCVVNHINKSQLTKRFYLTQKIYYLDYTTH